MAALQTHSQSEPQGALGEALSLVAQRVRSQRRTHGGVRGLIAALALDILLAALSRADVLPAISFLYPLLVVLPVAGTSLGGYFASRSPLTPMDAARLAEARLPLKERLSSALEFEGALHPNSLFALQHADADAHARAVDARLVAPRRLPREAWLVPVLLILLALTLCLPRLPFAPTPAQRAERDLVQQAGQQLAQAAHTAARQADARHDEAAKRQAQKMEALGKRMAQGHMDRAQALAAVSQQEQQLAASGQSSPAVPSDPGQAAKSLAGAAHSSAQTAQPPSASSQSAPASASVSKPDMARGLPTGPQTHSQIAKQTPARAAQPSQSGQSPSRPASRTETNAQNGTRHPNTHTGNSKASNMQQPAGPARTSQTARQDHQAARRQSRTVPPSPSASAARQALENARRQLAGSSASPSSASGKPDASNKQSPSSAPAKAGSAGRPGPSSQFQPSSSPGAGKFQGQSQGGNGKASSASSPQGKGQGGQSGQGKPGGQTADKAGGSPGQPAPGGGAAQASKAPFQSALPPTTSSKGQGIYLGASNQNSAQGTTLRKQSGLPAAPIGPSRVPYGQVLPRYRKSAEAALDQEQVPPSQRAVVRDYFNSLPSAK